VSLHRFLAYAVLGFWIGLTGVVIGTALQWSAASSMSEVKVQRARDAQKEASTTLAVRMPHEFHVAPEDQELADELQRSNNQAVVKAEAASEAMAEALNFELIERKRFWWELGVWGCLTLLSSALLAERRDGDERAIPHK
jgi:hypothetical protein